ncbi:MAG: T9SS type A sorting domain-containing protein [Chitinophagaceae bacterium]|nr:T9SS type A sorting domain-containing protein [Chitinophagaceae bacterium]
MKNTWITVCMLWLLAGSIQAQTIVSGEYFFDQDPGVGNAVPVSVTAAAQINQQVSVPIGALPEGFHSLGMRFKTDAGHWGQYTQRMLYVLSGGSQSVFNFSAAEYFIDADPGVGNAVAFSVSTGSTFSTLLNIALNNLSEGFHTLTIRFKDAGGKWALYTQRMFFVASNANTSANIVAAEYLIDADPGVNSAMPVAVSITPGATVATLIDAPVTGLAEGFHTLALRFKNADGLWGAYSQRLFYITPSALATGNIVAAEYFIDTDPGVGLAANLPVPAPAPTVAGNFAVAVPPVLNNGQHFLFIRVKDEQQRWSLYAMDTFTVNNALPVTGMTLKASWQNNQALLSWHTLTETNSRYFDIERSADAIHYQRVGKVPAAGNSVQKRQYQFIDENAQAGVLYYRLKQLDMDGAFVYSNVVILANTLANTNLQAMPNPASHQVRFAIPASNQKLVFSVYDAAGKFVFATSSAQPVLDVRSLAAGTYFVTITDGVQHWQARVVKQ